MSSIKTILFISTATVLTIVATYLHQRRKKSIRIPKNWKSVGKVSNLFIYPLKSGRRYEITKAECTEYGFKEIIEEEEIYALRDRQFIVYNAYDGEHRTARTYPKLVLIEITAIDSNHFILKAPGLEPFTLELPQHSKNKEGEVQHFKGEKIYTLDCGNEIAKWISRYALGKDSGLRIGYHDGKHRRDIRKPYESFMKVYENLNNDTTGMYSDIGNYLMLNQTSVDDLNTRIEDGSVTTHYFRPNILIEGPEAYTEDKWDVVKVGDVVFKYVKLCTRCMLTTIDPENGVRNLNREPLTTLEKYRQVEDPAQKAIEKKSPVMGIYISPLNLGIINVGDEVYVAN